MKGIINQPRPLHIYCEWTDGKHNGIARLRPANTIEEAKEIITADRRAMQDTFGGLLKPVKSQRNYKVFRAEWTEVTDQL